MLTVIAWEIPGKSVNIISSYFVASGTLEPVELTWSSPTRPSNLNRWSSSTKINQDSVDKAGLLKSRLINIKASVLLKLSNLLL
jgi:hypothetical protein